MIVSALRVLKQGCLKFKHAKGNRLCGKNVIGRNVVLKGTTLAFQARVAANASIVASTIGEYSSIGRSSKITHTTIGKFCAISWDCTINALSHPIDSLTVSAFPYVPEMGNFVSRRVQEYRQVVIGSDVWIGANSVVLPGITVGAGAVIGAGSVVTKDVPAYAIFAGVPAKLIRYRFPVEMTERLLRLEWWNLPVEVIYLNVGLFQGPLDEVKLKKLEEICE